MENFVAALAGQVAVLLACCETTVRSSQSISWDTNHRQCMQIKIISHEWSAIILSSTSLNQDGRHVRRQDLHDSRCTVFGRLIGLLTRIEC